MSITNLPKEYKITWATWLTTWANNTLVTWAQLSGEAQTGVTKPVQYETFDSLTTTFDTETRTFDEMGTTWTNTALGASGFLWSVRRFPWTEATPWLSEGGITNVAKP